MAHPHLLRAIRQGDLPLIQAYWAGPSNDLMSTQLTWTEALLEAVLQCPHSAIVEWVLGVWCRIGLPLGTLVYPLLLRRLTGPWCQPLVVSAVKCLLEGDYEGTNWELIANLRGRLAQLALIMADVVDVSNATFPLPTLGYYDCPAIVQNLEGQPTAERARQLLLTAGPGPQLTAWLYPLATIATTSEWEDSLLDWVDGGITSSAEQLLALTPLPLLLELISNWLSANLLDRLNEWTWLSLIWSRVIGRLAPQVITRIVHRLLNHPPALVEVIALPIISQTLQAQPGLVKSVLREQRSLSLTSQSARWLLRHPERPVHLAEWDGTAMQLPYAVMSGGLTMIETRDGVIITAGTSPVAIHHDQTVTLLAAGEELIVDDDELVLALFQERAQ